MSKGLPKRAGEIVDMICEKAGVRPRMVPHSMQLHKSEAIAILTYIQTLEETGDDESVRTV